MHYAFQYIIKLHGSVLASDVFGEIYNSVEMSYIVGKTGEEALQED